MTTTVLSPLLVQRFVDNSGNPLVNGQIFTYVAGSTTPQATYTDSTGGTPNTNPVILNSRGEASIWIPPNTAYKFVIEDQFGNIIKTIDQVIASQLITLYGGVDTGTTNNYILNFTANFSAYADGIVIYWIPAHNNTGPSTINVNGLGVVSLTNQDGSSLGANELVTNQVATIMYKGGAFLLIASGTIAVSGTFTGTLTGFGSTLTQTISYWINAKQCILRSPATLGTSNATSMTMTGLPNAVTPQSGASTIPCVLEDNGASIFGWAQVNSGTGTITFGAGAGNNQSGFTASGTKGLNAGWCITYPLG
jgi:hypothetical protein